MDAVLYHDGRTSPTHSNVRYGLHHRLQRDTGLPAIIIEADTHDLRLVSLDQLQRQLAEFIERSQQHPADAHHQTPAVVEEATV